jgi:hypothetical protein
MKGRLAIVAAAVMLVGLGECGNNSSESELAN